MFLNQTPDWAALGENLLAALSAKTRQNSDTFALVVFTKAADGTAQGFAHRAMTPIYPCSLVKSFHLVHALSALEQGRAEPHGEMDRALRDMIRYSSNTATNYVIDCITGTTGDTLLQGAEYLDWVSKRERLNRFFWSLGWPEWDGSTISQKLMDDTRYGREAQYAGPDGANLNALPALAPARLLWELFHGDLPLSSPMKSRAQAILQRDPNGAEAANVAYQTAEYLSGGLPQGVEVWSKAGHNLWTGEPKTSWFKHDMARFAALGRRPLFVVLMTQGRALAQENPAAFPAIGRLIWDMTAEITRI